MASIITCDISGVPVSKEAKKPTKEMQDIYKRLYGKPLTDVAPKFYQVLERLVTIDKEISGGGKADVPKKTRAPRTKAPAAQTASLAGGTPQAHASAPAVTDAPTPQTGAAK
jgi:hypothetical protein